MRSIAYFLQSCCVVANNGFRRTALRAAAEAERYTIKDDEVTT